jgi:ribosome maturation factor RimP
LLYFKALWKEDGRFAHFLFVERYAMDLQALLETTLTGLGYELVDLERSGRGRLLRVFIDKAGGVNVDDCVAVSHHLNRLLPVEGVAYDRLEVSSPGLDRLLKKERDFVRFAGQKARIKLRIPVDGQRNFVGVLRETRAGKVQLEIDGKLLSLDLDNLEKARLVPAI